MLMHLLPENRETIPQGWQGGMGHGPSYLTMPLCMGSHTQPGLINICRNFSQTFDLPPLLLPLKAPLYGCPGRSGLYPWFRRFGRSPDKFNQSVQSILAISSLSSEPACFNDDYALIGHTPPGQSAQALPHCFG